MTQLTQTKRKRNCYYISVELQDAMKVVADVERITQSHQIELALMEYLKKYKDLLKEHNIEL